MQGRYPHGSAASAGSPSPSDNPSSPHYSPTLSPKDHSLHFHLPQPGDQGPNRAVSIPDPGPSTESGPRPTQGGRQDGLLSSARRREANRLAAQRFRNRKKNYHDNLEERLKVLENEKREMLQASPGGWGGMGMSADGPSSSPHALSASKEFADDKPWAVSPLVGISRFSSHSTDQAIPTDGAPAIASYMSRISALEAANLRLQQEMLDLRQENRRMRDDIEMMRDVMGVDGEHPRNAHRPSDSLQLSGLRPHDSLTWSNSYPPAHNYDSYQHPRPPQPPPQQHAPPLHKHPDAYTPTHHRPVGPLPGGVTLPPIHLSPLHSSSGSGPSVLRITVPPPHTLPPIFHRGFTPHSPPYPQ